MPPWGSHQRALSFFAVVLLHVAALLLWLQSPAKPPVQAHIEAPERVVIHVALAPLHTTPALPVPPVRTAMRPPPTPATAVMEQQASRSTPAPPLQELSLQGEGNVRSDNATLIETQAPALPKPAAATHPVADLAHSSAEYLHNPAPAYPPASRRRGEEGRVMVSALVSAEGIVKEASVEVSSGFPRLDEAALTAVRTWRFVPAAEGGVAVPKRHVIPLIFVLAGT